MSFPNYAMRRGIQALKIPWKPLVCNLYDLGGRVAKRPHTQVSPDDSDSILRWTEISQLVDWSNETVPIGYVT